MVEHRQVLAAQLLDGTLAVCVPIPGAKRNGDTANTRFHQPAGQQQVLGALRGAAEAGIGFLRCAVPLADAGGFAVQIDGFGQAIGRQ